MTQSNILLASTNAARTRFGVAALQANTLLDQVAQSHAESMAREGYFDHIDAQGRGAGERLSAVGYNYRWCGENISAGKADAQDVVDWWLSSESHRANLLKHEFTETGFGYCFIERDRNFFHHYWVQILASRESLVSYE